MLNVFDPLFLLNDNDLLSVEDNGPLNNDNINTTIEEMVERIAYSMGYDTCEGININNYTDLDYLYTNNNSIVIPIFNEKVVTIDGTKELGDTLTNANVSFVVITPKCGNIDKPKDKNSYCCTDNDGYILDQPGNVMYNRLTNIRFYRYASNEKFDYIPNNLDILAPIYYCYKGSTSTEIEEVKLCIEGCFNFYMNQQVVEGFHDFLPFYPTTFYDYCVESNHIKCLNNNNLDFNKLMSNINDLGNDSMCCHIYNNFYLIK